MSIRTLSSWLWGFVILLKAKSFTPSISILSYYDAICLNPFIPLVPITHFLPFSMTYRTVGPLCTTFSPLSHPSIPLPPWRGPWIPSFLTTSFPPWQWDRKAPLRLPGRRKHPRSCGYQGHCHAVVSGLSCRGHRGCPWATTSASIYPCHHSAAVPGF